MVEDELMHPLHADVFVDKGDPVVIARALGATPHTAYGLAVGVAFNSATALTDEIAIDTEGIWNLNVNAFDDNGGVDVNPGDALFISDDSVGSDDSSHDGIGNCVISKIRNNVTQIPFGYALGYIAGGAYGVIAVKVHWDPRAHWLMDDEPLLFGYGAAANGDMTLTHDGTDLTLVGLVNGGAFIIGNGTESMDVQIFGNAAAYSLLWDSSLNTLNIVSMLAAVDNVLDINLDSQASGGSVYGINIWAEQTDGAITNEFGGINSSIRVGGTSVAHAYAVQAYTSIAATPTIGDMCAYHCYCDNLGATAGNVNSYACVRLNIDSTARASGSTAGNSFFYLYSHGANADQYFYIPDLQGATYLFNWPTAIVVPVTVDNTAEAWTHNVACLVGGAVRYIKLSSQ